MSCGSCTLPRSDRPARRALLAATLADDQAEVTASDRQVRWRFPDAEVFTALAEIVELERACCGQLCFTLRVPSGGGAELTISGPPGTRGFLAEWLPDGVVPAP